MVNKHLKAVGLFDDGSYICEEGIGSIPFQDVEVGPIEDHLAGMHEAIPVQSRSSWNAA